MTTILSAIISAAEAIDPEGSGRTYTETDVDIQYSERDSGAVDEPDNP